MVRIIATFAGLRVHPLRVSIVPTPVQRAFGVTGDEWALPGGAGTSVAIGGVVLKPVDDPQEAAWAADLLAGMQEDGFRLARPVRCRDGSWVVDGWSAAGWVEGKVGPADHWEELLATARAFHAALRAALCPDFLRRRRHRWAHGDRVAWQEEPAVPVPEVKTLLEDLLGHLHEMDGGEPQLVHGDLSGNVLFAPGLPPAVIDFSPFWRPTSYAEAIAAVDGVLWLGVDGAVLQRVADQAGSVQPLVRALAFRLVTLNERAREDPDALHELSAYHAVWSSIRRLSAS
jgi:uncharacterized protein (TIGR02569 family)